MMPEQQLPHQALHQSVLLREVVAALSPADDAIYLDATFGNGGYSRALLEAAGCKVIAIDRDPDAIQRGQPMLAEFAGRFSLVEGCFSQMAGLLDPEVRLAGAAFDLGVCSTQLDQPERGFSFRADGPLDMRMSKSGGSAADVVMQADERMLAQILWDYGEEKASRRIARAIVSARRDGPITTTSQLAAVIHAVMPAKRPGQIDPATRSFQALRIYINRELDELTDGLAAVEAMLEPGGILAVVSFIPRGSDRQTLPTARSQAAARPSATCRILTAPPQPLNCWVARRLCLVPANRRKTPVRTQQSCVSPAAPGRLPSRPMMTPPIGKEGARSCGSYCYALSFSPRLAPSCIRSRRASIFVRTGSPRWNPRSARPKGKLRFWKQSGRICHARSASWNCSIAFSVCARLPRTGYCRSMRSQCGLSRNSRIVSLGPDR